MHPNTPILIGVGQTIDHWNGADIASAPSPITLAARAARAALADTGAVSTIAGEIDVIAVVRTLTDSVTGAKAPFGRCENPPATIAFDLGLKPRRAIYSAVGGDQPQALVNEFAEEIFSGQARAVLLTGAEATAAMKMAKRKRIALDWRRTAAGSMEDRGIGAGLLSAYEIANGLGAPTQTYPIFEHALRARLGLSREAHRELMAGLCANLSESAAGNPYAQFPHAHDSGFLAAPSAANYEVADPYLKWHVAQDAVNQGAALILTSVECAQACGIDPKKWIYLHGYAQAADRFVSERADLSRSRAMEVVLGRAMDSARRSIDDIAYCDLYSCFPCAVLIAAEHLGLDWRTRPVTVTGGLPFFGGAGNNYSMHAIASMVERLRVDRDSFGLVLANGGFLSKEAAGVYSARAVPEWRPIPCGDLRVEIDAAATPPLLQESCEAVIDAYTVTYAKGQPQRGYVLAHTSAGRILARARSGHRATLAALARLDPIGRTVRIVHEDNINYICASDEVGAAQDDRFLSRQFQFVSVLRRGHVLEVTLNRPESLNSLHSAAHFELHEIWDDFESDSDLWVAILTGAGDRAFCSGNDLKATAKGGDLSTPRSGFAGLCNRLDRTKPIIVAVNGVAMGGGMEIVLACDLAIADPRATFALPEVKVGFFAAAGGVHRLTRQIPRKIAMDLILTGRRIEAEEALSLGLINSIATEGAAIDEARRLADLLLANSPRAIRASKQALNVLDASGSLSEALASNKDILSRLMRTHDFKEGVSAFAEKRKPRWTNS